MKYEKAYFDHIRRSLIYRIVKNSLDTVSYKSQKRTDLIRLVTADIFLKDDKKLWKEEVEKFVMSNKNNAIKTYSKYYTTDRFEAVYNDSYLFEHKELLVELVYLVRGLKNQFKERIELQGNIRSYFKDKRLKKSRNH